MAALPHVWALQLEGNRIHNISSRLISWLLLLQVLTCSSYLSSLVSCLPANNNSVVLSRVLQQVLSTCRKVLIPVNSSGNHRCFLVSVQFTSSFISLFNQNFVIRRNQSFWLDAQIVDNITKKVCSLLHWTETLLFYICWDQHCLWNLKWTAK